MLFSNLPTQKRAPKDLPKLNLASPWRPPSELPSLKSVKRLGFDIETRDDDLVAKGPGVRRGAYVVGMSLALDLDGPRMYIPVRHQGGGNLDLGVVKRWAKAELNAFDGEVVGANLIYDLDFMGHDEWGVTFPHATGFHDVLLADPIIDEWQFSYSLDAVSLRRLGEGKVYGHAEKVCLALGWKKSTGEPDLTQFRKNLWRLGAGDVGEYAEGDADLPLRVLDAQVPLLMADDQLHIYDMERKLVPILRDMRKRGVKVNLGRAEQVRGMLDRELRKWDAELKRLAGPKADFNANASFVPALLEAGHELPKTRPSKTYPDGQASVTTGWLEARVSDPLCAALVACKRLDKIKSTFVDNYVFGHQVKGRLHAEFNQLKGEDDSGNMRGTIARFSSSNPNLQNIPSRERKVDALLNIDDAVGDAIRSIFEPDDGDEWQRDDASQIEFRFTVNSAVGAGAEEAREMYRQNPDTDFHVYCGDLAGIDGNDTKKRKGVKNLNFARGYGAGEEKIASMLGWTVEEARDFIRRYNEGLPFMQLTYQKCDRSAAKFGYVLTCLNRKCRFPLWEPKYNPWPKQPGRPYDQAREEYGSKIVRSDTYKAMNRKMQGSGAELMKKAMIDVHEAGITNVIGPYLLTVHDELDTSVPRTREGDEAGRELTRIMETCITGLRVPIIVKRQRGLNWGECG